MADESTPQSSSEDQAAKAAKPAAKAAKAGAKPKKEKPPKLEDKPFEEFIQQHYLPDLEAALKGEGLEDLQLSFEKRKLEITGDPSSDDCWQVTGQWFDGNRQFQVAFLDADITGQKVFAYSTGGAKPSTIEQFMGDERRITLGLLVMYTVQRLNGQKWLTRN